MTEYKKVLVCGGRNFCDYEKMCKALDQIVECELIIQGGYRGADTLAKQYAKERAIHCAEVPALWKKYGPRAGPLRNRMMLQLKPDVVVAFAGGSGTQDMINAARVAGVRVWGVGMDIPR